jgi:drug/metabolite transporter (DMT)-like permease
MAPRHIGLLAALAAVWGGSYLLIKWGLEDFEPAVIVWIRLVLAALVLYAVMLLRNGGAEARAAKAELRARPWRAILLGAVAIALPFNLITFGELEVPSGLTAVLIAPASLFVAAFAPLIDPSEKVPPSALGGMILGLAGVALCVGVESVHSIWAFLGALAMVGAAACYALSSFIVKRYKGLTSVTTSFISILVAVVLTLPAAVATAPTHMPGLRATLAILALGIIGTALAFVIFYKLIAEVGAGRASLVSYLAPGVALLYGAVFLDEEITVAALVGLGLILGGVALASRRNGSQPVAERAGVPGRGSRLAGREPSRADARG